MLNSIESFLIWAKSCMIKANWGFLSALLLGLTLLSGCSQSEPGETAKPAATQNSSSGAGVAAGTVTDTVSASKTGAGNAQPPASLVYDGTMSGVVGDSMCGKDHMMMGDVGKDVVNCTKDCVKQGYKFVLIDEKGESFVLDDQITAEKYAGKSVSVSGHINRISKTIDVKSVKPLQ